MAILADTKATRSPQLQALQDAARARDVEVSIHQIASAEEITAAIDAAKASDAATLNVLSSPVLYSNRQLIIGRVAALRLPAIYPWAEEAEEGGFLAYGPRVLQILREIVTRQLVKLLRGVKPADIPSSNRQSSSWSSISRPLMRCRDGARDVSGTRRQGNRIHAGPSRA